MLERTTVHMLAGKLVDMWEQLQFGSEKVANFYDKDSLKMCICRSSTVAKIHIIAAIKKGAESRSGNSSR